MWLLEWHLFNYLPNMHVEHIKADQGNFDEDRVFGLVETALARYRKYHA